MSTLGAERRRTSSKPGSLSLLQMRQDVFKDAVGVLHHVDVPVSDDTIAAGFQNVRSGLIRLEGLRVLSAIQFNDQLCIVTQEVDDEPVDGHLAPEFPAPKLSVSKLEPQLPFRLGRSSAQ